VGRQVFDERREDRVLRDGVHVADHGHVTFGARHGNVQASMFR
jgi:hypothetical protein